MANKKLRVNVTVPEGFQPGDTFMIEVEIPGGRRAQREVKPIEEMTKEELKREIINAGSVLYKAQKRGAAEEIIQKNQERLDAAKALMAEKFPKPIVEKKAGGTAILHAEGRVLTQDEIDHPENYTEGDTDAETATEI
jgi:hypothetical protein